jgi:hypothetical protein
MRVTTAFNRLLRLPGAHVESPWLPWPGNGTKIATANTTNVSTITTTLDTVIVKKCQCTVCAGWFRLTIAAMSRDITTVLAVRQRGHTAGFVGQTTYRDCGATWREILGRRSSRTACSA